MVISPTRSPHPLAQCGGDGHQFPAKKSQCSELTSDYRPITFFFLPPKRLPSSSSWRASAFPPPFIFLSLAFAALLHLPGYRDCGEIVYFEIYSTIFTCYDLKIVVIFFK